MLKTALKPRWILSLVLALAVAAAFVLLSQWQFSRSQEGSPPPVTSTEVVKPLTEVFRTGIAMPAAVADQMVTMNGAFVPNTRILVQNRLRDGVEGLWVVSAFEVDGSGADDVIPVVHGWVPDAEAAEELPEPEGGAVVVGRLLPTEAPVAQRPVPGQVPSLSVAELINRWDRQAYSGFVVSFETAVDGTTVAPAPPLQAVDIGPQPQETSVNWLNIFYAAEWVVFAGFSFFLWWRLVADDYRRSREDAEQHSDADELSEAAPAGGQRSEVKQ